MNIQTMIERLNKRDLDKQISFCTNTNVDIEKKRYLKLLNDCKKVYGDGDYHLYSSPARSELCGNHTDHQQGKVIAACINTDMVAIIKSNEKNIVSLTSFGFEIKEVDLSDCSFRKEEVNTSTGLIRGIAYYMKNKGMKIQGFEGCIQSNIPVGSGMSSSASFEVLIAMAFNDLFNGNELNESEIAQICQESENYYYQKALWINGSNKY